MKLAPMFHNRSAGSKATIMKLAYAYNGPNLRSDQISVLSPVAEPKVNISEEYQGFVPGVQAKLFCNTICTCHPSHPKKNVVPLTICEK
jgi:hypothetical protein